MRIFRFLLLSALVGLALCRVVLYLIYAVIMLPSPVETHHLEAKMVLLTYRAQAGLSLYPEWHHGPYVSNFFAPVYFGTVGLIGRLLGSDLTGLFQVGRLVSFGSGLLTAIVVGWVAARRYGTWAGLVGAIASVGSAPLFGFSVMVRPDMTAEFLGVLGFFLAMAERSGLRWSGVAVLILAAMTKQTAVIYAGAAVLAWFAAGSWRRGLEVGIGVGGTLLLVVGLVTLLFEPNFAPSLASEGKTPWETWAMWETARRIRVLAPDTFVFPLLGLWFWLRRTEPTTRRDLAPAILGLILVLTSVVTSAKRGSDLNYYLGIRAVSGLAVAALWHAWMRVQGRTALIGLTLLTVVVGRLLITGIVNAEIGRNLAQASVRFDRSNSGREAHLLLNRFKNQAANPSLRMLTDSGVLDLQRRDRAVFGDPWLFRMLVETGRIDPALLRKQIEAREFDVVVTTKDVFDPDYDRYDFGLPKTLAEPVRAGYVLSDRVVGFFFYNRRPASSGGPVPGSFTP